MWRSQSGLRGVRRVLGPLVLFAAVLFVLPRIDVSVLGETARRAVADPVGLSLALLAYAAAFLLRGLLWRAVLPELRLGHALAALHTSLAANHLLPFRLGEAVRVTDVVRRADVPVQSAVASTVLLRGADVAAVVALGALLAPRAVGQALDQALGAWMWPLIVLGAAVPVVAGLWLRRVVPGSRRAALPLALAGALGAWLLESVMLLRAAEWAGFSVGFMDAVLVTAVTIATQVVAIAPGGLGTYEAAATAAFVALGAEPAQAFAAGLAAHAVKTAYALVGGLVALWLPRPGVLGALRLPRRLPPRLPVPAPDGPVVLFLPAHDEEDAVAEVVRRTPAQVCGRAVCVLVIDDGSRDQTAARAEAAGATVLRHEVNRGLGAAVRTGMSAAVEMGAAAVAFCDADGEYAPEELERLIAPILGGQADYVAGSRFAGEIRHMRPHRRLGNVVLTRVLRWVARTPITDGQTGYRAFSREAAQAAEIVHDYNYAQVLTLDLLGKGFRYLEVPIGYAFRETGASFVKLGRYLRAVGPAVYRELNTAHT